MHLYAFFNISFENNGINALEAGTIGQVLDIILWSRISSMGSTKLGWFWKFRKRLCADLTASIWSLTWANVFRSAFDEICSSCSNLRHSWSKFSARSTHESNVVCVFLRPISITVLNILLKSASNSKKPFDGTKRSLFASTSTLPFNEILNWFEIAGSYENIPFSKFISNFPRSIVENKRFKMNVRMFVG